MAFVDQATIEIKSGKGGDGIVSFRHEKFVNLGGPFGGDGGRGGDVIFQVNEGLRTLMDFRYNRHFKAKPGGQGGTKGMTGASADNLIVKVPQGTLVFDDETGQQLADLTENKSEFTVAKGGRGGRGNMRFATANNPAPEISENGEPGETKKIRLELRVLADVGLVGFPSAGKSTFLSVVTSAKPKIAPYHFTTLSPNLGMVRLENEKDFVIADLPGLIEGAASGVGLGFEFLRHVERTKVVLHFIDMSGDSGIDFSPFEAYQKILSELKEYDESILNRPHIIVASKMDLPNSNESLAEFKKELEKNPVLAITPEIFPISSITHDGTQALLHHVSDILDQVQIQQLAEQKSNSNVEKEVVYQFSDDTKKKQFDIVFDQDQSVWVIRNNELEKLFSMTNLSREASIMRFSRQLRSMGVDDALRESGVEPGDDVRIADSDFIFEFSD